MLGMIRYPRLITAMITPFKEDLSVDYEGAQRLAINLLEAGNEGLVITGTTGESPTLSKQEKLDLYKAVKEAVGTKGCVIAGTGSYSTAESVSLTREAEKTGVDGIMAVTPYYNKPNPEGLYRHFKAIADTTSLPVIMYNVPGRTSVNILPETVARLAGIANIKAIKEASGSMDHVSAIRTMTPQDFLIYSGDDTLTLPILAMGGYGVISVVAHVAAREMKQMIYAYVGGKVEEAALLHQRLFPLIRAMFITTNPIPVKRAVALLGLPAGSLRLPLVDASESETAKIREAMAAFKLL